MKILAIETSCDETSAAVVEKTGEQTVKVYSNVTATSLEIHAKTGGIIPENAAREQVKYIIPVLTQALIEYDKLVNSLTREPANILKHDVDAIAVTYGPGLIGSLMVGVETAKTLSYVFNKPIIPVNHLLAHLFANSIESPNSHPSSVIRFPAIGLIVSGGHTDLLLFESFSKYKWLGGTKDDAAGEALDKIGRLLNLSYPAGPEIERRANLSKQSMISNKPSVSFHSPMINSRDFDFSFSGLKAESARFIENQYLTKRLTNEVCASLQDAIIKVLIKKTTRAAKLYSAKSILLGGGVAANNTLKSRLEDAIEQENLRLNLFVPEKKYATDNAAMVGAYAAINGKTVDWSTVSSDPELYFA